MDPNIEKFKNFLADQNRPVMDQKLLPLLQLTPKFGEYVDENQKFIENLVQVGLSAQKSYENGLKFWVKKSFMHTDILTLGTVKITFC